MKNKRYGIITFHFAHNYGAMLQAKALKDYISQYGDTSIVNYVPHYMTKVYSLNPFRKGLRKLPYNFKRILVRKKQYDLFEHFLKDELSCTKSTVKREKLREDSKKYDAIIYGSDQIWNTDLTSDDSLYFGNYIDDKTRRVSYAASFGTTDLSQAQKNMIRDFVAHFDAISIREDDGKKDIFELLGKEPTIVLDPVFLKDREYWTELAKKSSYHQNEKYILYYSLKENAELIEMTEKIATMKNLNILAINPVCEKSDVKATHLRCVGPLEFLALINNAEMVCTNSFHASAFSVIFQKKLFHVSFPGKEGRVGSLISRLNGQKYKECLFENCEIYDWSKLDVCLLDKMINESKRFLDTALCCINH